MKRLLKDLATIAFWVMIFLSAVYAIDYYRYPSPPDPADGPILKSITVKEGR